MNQTKKRLAIIKLAISMTDTETIQLQVLKLGLLKTDAKMREILSHLNEQNYAQAQRLISAYIETPGQTTVIQRTAQKEMDAPAEKVISLTEKIQKVKDQAIIDQFELFTESSETDIPKVQEEVFEVSYDELLDTAPKPKKMSTQNVNYDALLQVNADDVLSDNINLDISETKKDAFFQEELTLHTEEKTEDNFFKVPKTTTEENLTQVDTVSIEKPIHKELFITDEDVKHTSDSKSKDTSQYAAIPYIDQKFRNISNQYPAIDNSTEDFTSVDTLLISISKHSYNDVDIENTIQNADLLSTDSKAEAAQLLLISAATESKYAQFRLARALYTGELLEKNLAESFTIINRLAVNDDYPEAICDLAQFYENGIGITKDKKKAEVLYKEAMELGIQRASDHYERLKKENKGLFSSFLK